MVLNCCYSAVAVTLQTFKILQWNTCKCGWCGCNCNCDIAAETCKIVISLPQLRLQTTILNYDFDLSKIYF